jgi:hypothetical protein
MGSDPFTLNQSGERDDRVSCLLYTGLCLVSSINTGSKDPTCHIYLPYSNFNTRYLYGSYQPKISLRTNDRTKEVSCLKVLKGTQYQDMAGYENFKNIQYQK